MAKYTQGKWKLSDKVTEHNPFCGDMEYYYVLGEIGGNSERTIATIGCWKDRGNTLEDARLIVAAPEMYGIIKDLYEWPKSCGHEFTCNCCEKRARAVLASIDGGK